MMTPFIEVGNKGGQPFVGAGGGELSLWLVECEVQVNYPNGDRRRLNV
jgi:hypothetical protein